MSDTPHIVKETLTYSDGTEKVVHFNLIGESTPEVVVSLEEALSAAPEEEEVVEEEVEEEEVDEEEETPESETDESEITL